MAALPPDQGDDYQLTSLFLVGGKLYASYTRAGVSYQAQICHVLDDPHAIITTGGFFISKIRHPFRFGHLIDENVFYVVEKVREVEGRAEGKLRGRDVWLPILRNNENDKVLYVFDPNAERLKLVILEDETVWTSWQRIGIGLAVGAAAAGTAVVAVVAAPVAIAAIGFGAAGIVAGSAAATMMSMGVIGVATLQSIGAAGMGVASIIIVGGVGATAGAAAAGAAAAGAAGALSNAAYWIDGQGMMALFLVRNRQPVPLPPVIEILQFDNAPELGPSPDGPDAEP